MAAAFSSVLENEKAFDAISDAAVALNCETLKSTIDQFGLGSQCGFICWLICSWRYVWVCREFCQLRSPVLNGAYGVEEAQNFALASRKLASQPRALADLVSAVRNRDAKTFGEIIDRYGLGPYCYQVCAWVCSVTCYGFCICVCPPSAYPPWFTQVGNFDIYTRIDPSSGLTNTQLPIVAPLYYGGGPDLAFFNQLVLGGWCPATSPAFPGQARMYRFLYAKDQTTLASPITSASQTTISVVSSAGGEHEHMDQLLLHCAARNQSGTYNWHFGYTGETNQLTFCICGYGNLTAPAAVLQAKKR